MQTFYKVCLILMIIGGGTIRDLLLDVTPGWMTDPIYLICTGLALLWVIFFGKHLIHLHNTFFIFDTIGLALFTVVGVAAVCGIPGLFAEETEE